MIIRKISIGPDLKSAMHYSVGQTFTITNGESREEVYISLILENQKNKEYIDIYATLKRTNETYVWKSVTKTTPQTFEHDLNF
jgi:hypothetical protein